MSGVDNACLVLPANLLKKKEKPNYQPEKSIQISIKAVEFLHQHIVVVVCSHQFTGGKAN